MTKLTFAKEENASFSFSLFDTFSNETITKFFVHLELNANAPQQVNVIISSDKFSALNHQRNSQHSLVFYISIKK